MIHGSSRRLVTAAALLAGTAMVSAVHARTAEEGALQFDWQPSLTQAIDARVQDRAAATFAAHPTDPNSAVACFGNVPHPKDPDSVGNGCWSTNNWGGSWNLISNDRCVGDPLSEFGTLCVADNVVDVAVCPANGDVIYVATHNKGFFRSDDAGVSWNNISAGIEHRPTTCGEVVSKVRDTFQSRLEAGAPWTGLSVTVSPQDCNQLFVTVADIAGDHVAFGGASHPGIYASRNGGATWTADGTCNRGISALSDPFECHPEQLSSRTVFPVSVEFAPNGTLMAAGGELNISTDPFGPATSHSQLRVFAAEATNASCEDILWQESKSPALDATRTTISTPAANQYAVSLSVGQLAMGGGENNPYAVATHFNLSTLYGPVMEFIGCNHQSQGVVAGRLGAADGAITWAERDLGLPARSGQMHTQATTLSPVAIQPGGDLWLVGTAYIDPGQDDLNESFVWAGPGLGQDWVNTSDRALGTSMLISPTQGLEESAVTSLVWNADGTKAFANVMWTDNFFVPTPVRSGGNGDEPGQPGEAEPKELEYKDCVEALGERECQAQCEAQYKAEECAAEAAEAELDNGVYMACPFEVGGRCAPVQVQPGQIGG